MSVTRRSLSGRAMVSSPPTSGSSNPSSSRRCSRVTSARRNPVGAFEADRRAGYSAHDVVQLPMSTLHILAVAQGLLHLRHQVLGCEVDALQDGMQQGADQRPTGHGAQPQGHGAVRGLVHVLVCGQFGEHAVGRTRHLLIERHVSLGLAGDGRLLLVRCVRDRRVRGTPPMRVEVTSEGTDAERRGALRGPLPPDARRPLDTLDRHFLQRGEGGHDGGVGLGPLPDRRDLAIGLPVEQEARQ